MTTRVHRTEKNMGPIYAALLAVGWGFLHIFGVFVLDPLTQPLLATLTILALTWFYTGLFIVAHDAIHETLFGRGNPWNRRIGRVIHFLYAGFDFDTMKSAHIDHHDFPGSEHDPDFNADDPRSFGPWFAKFFSRYFGLRQIWVVMGLAALQLLLGANILNLVLLWGLPSILSAVQLFYFGTYLTHRHDDDFADDHNARSNSYPEWLSLLTCFHFGYHHEHHLHPEDPWWRLPTRRAERLAGDMRA